MNFFSPVHPFSKIYSYKKEPLKINDIYFNSYDNPILFYIKKEQVIIFALENILIPMMPLYFITIRINI